MSVESGSKGNEALSNKGFFDYIREWWNSLKNFLSEKFKAIKDTLKNLNILKRDVVDSNQNSGSGSVNESVEVSHNSLKGRLTQICVRSRQYGSIYEDDNWSVSIWKLQFHAWNAEKVLTAIRNVNPSRFDSIMTDPLFRDIHKASFSVWNPDQVSQYRKLMEDRSAQREMDKIVDDTIQGYIDRIHGRWLVTDPKATLAFWRICNYWPVCAENIKNIMVENWKNINDYNQVIDCYEANTTWRVQRKFQIPDPALWNKNIREFIGECWA